MSSQDYTIEEYQRSKTGIMYLPTVGVKCTDISTKSIDLAKANDLRRLIVDAKFFDDDLSSYQVPPTGGKADPTTFKIKIRDDGKILKDGTNPTKTVTGIYPPDDSNSALKDLVQYIDKLCQEISK